MRVVDIERESVEIRPIYVRAVDDDGVLVDLTLFDVDVAFVEDNDRPTTWHHASWASGGPFPSSVGQAWQANIEIGGTGTNADVKLAVGSWRVFVRVATTAETPVIPAGRIVVR